MPLAEPETSAASGVDQMPISAEARAQLKAAISGTADRLPDHSIFAEPEKTEQHYLPGVLHQAPRRHSARRMAGGAAHG